MNNESYAHFLLCRMGRLFDQPNPVTLYMPLVHGYEGKLKWEYEAIDQLEQMGMVRIYTLPPINAGKPAVGAELTTKGLNYSRKNR